MVRVLRGLLAVMIAIAVGTVVVPTAQASEVGSILASVNRARADAGLAPLTLNSGLSSVASAWSGHLADSGTCPEALAHNPSFSSQIPGGWSRAGENVACNQPADPDGLESQWMASAGHRANILNPAYTDIGIGIVVQDGVAWGTQNFATYAESAPEPEPAAEAPAPAAPKHSAKHSAAKPAPEPAPEPAPAPAPEPAPEPAPAPAPAPAPPRPPVTVPTRTVALLPSLVPSARPAADTREVTRASSAAREPMGLPGWAVPGAGVLVAGGVVGAFFLRRRLLG